MTVRRITNYLVFCVATDTKPTGMATDAMAYVTDTGDIFRYNGTSWVLFNDGPTGTATLTNKSISGASNTITNIPDTALSANVPLINANNIFTAQQKVSVDLGQQMVFYRPVNTTGFGAGFYYNFNNSTPAEVTFGNQYCTVEDNTAGAHRGDFKVELASAATLAIRFRVYTSGNGGLIFGNNRRIQIDEGGLTATRIYTLPNYGTELGSTIDPVQKRVGWYIPAAGTTATTIGSIGGMLGSHTPTGPGTNTNTFDTTEGVLANLVTSATINQNAGLVSPTGGVGVGRRLFGKRARIRSKVDTVAGSVSRLYFGFTSATALPITDTPLATTDHGVIVGFSSTDTTYQIYHNDGATSVTKDAVTGAIAKDTAFHTIEINWTASGNVNVIFDGTSQTISADLPTTTTNLFFNAVVQNATAAIRTHSINGIWIESDK